MPYRRLNDTYTIIEEIGSGGGGIVYKAYHERLQILVVAKQIRQQVVGRIDSRAEADLLKRMKHTYLPRVYDFLEIDGKMYTVMDFIEGESLDKVLRRRGRIPQKEVLKWAIQLAEALSYLHEQDPPIIHSDIKPANIMLTPQGNICLIDFNVSLALDRSMRDSTGISIGYSPPEQYRTKEMYVRSVDMDRLRRRRAAAADSGDATATFPLTSAFSEASTAQTGDESVAAVLDRTIGRGIDRASDIYSLGATLYHLLTGIHPGIDFAEFLPIEETGVQLSEGFRIILSRMLALDPEQRYQNGTELLDAFRHIHELDGEYRSWRRSLHLKIAAGILLIALGAGLTAGGFLTIHAEKNTTYNELIAEAEAALEDGGYDTAEALLDEACTLLPKRSEAYVQYMMLLYSQDAWEDCVSYGESLLRNAAYLVEESELTNLLSGTCYVMGGAYLDLEEYSSAARYLEQALEYETGNSLYYRDYAIALAKTGQVEAANETLETAISLGLGEDSIYMVQGEISYAETDYEEAVSLLLQAIETAQTQDLRKRAVLLCDKAYRQLGDAWVDDDISLLETEIGAYSSSSSSAALKERLADACVRKAESDDSDESTAREYYQRALDLFTELYDSGYVTSQMLENLSILYEDLDRFEEAQTILLEMADLYPESYVPYKRLAFLEADRQQEKELEDRDYHAMKSYYETACGLYEEDSDYDQEMDMLEIMLQELEDGNWFTE